MTSKMKIGLRPKGNSRAKSFFCLKNTIIFVCICLFSCVPLASRGDAQTLLFDDFDGYPDGANLSSGGYGSWVGRWGGNITVSSEESISAPHSAKMDNNGWCWESQLFAPLPYNPVTWFSADIKGKASGRTGCHEVDAAIRLFNRDAGGDWGSHMMQIALMSGPGEFNIGPGLVAQTSGFGNGSIYAWEDLLNLEPDYQGIVDQWINVMAKVDAQESQADVWVDGEYRGSLVMNPACPPYTEIALDCGEGIGYVDNVHVFLDGPSPGDDAAVLEPLVPYTGNTGGGQYHFFKIESEPNKDLVVALDQQVTGNGTLQFYGRAGKAPVRFRYDYRESSQDHLLHQELLVPGTPDSRTCYFLVYDDSSGGQSSFTISASYPGFLLSNMTPTTGGNAGSVTVRCRGTGFTPETTASLIGSEGDVIRSAAIGFTDSTDMSATFDLTNQTPGIYDVILSKPDANDILFPGAFTIEAQGEAKLWVEIAGSDQIRLGRGSTYNINYGNTGNVDADGASFFVGVPANVRVELTMKGVDEPLTFGPDPEFAVLQATVPNVPAGGSGYFTCKIEVTDPSVSEVQLNILPIIHKVMMKANGIAPSLHRFAGFLNHASSDNEDPSTAIHIEIADLAILDSHKLEIVSVVHPFIVYGDLVFTENNGMWSSLTPYQYEQLKTYYNQPGKTIDKDMGFGCGYIFPSTTFREKIAYAENEDFAKGFRVAMDYNAEHHTPTGGVNTCIIGLQKYAEIFHIGTDHGLVDGHPNDKWDIAASFYNNLNIPQAISAAFILHKLRASTLGDSFVNYLRGSFEYGDVNVLSRLLKVIMSIDPNDKAGPSGYDSADTPPDQLKRFISGDHPLSYMVFFENLETATAAVQDMLISDNLDSNLDWSTFSFDTIQIGTHTVAVPKGKQSFATDVDLRPDISAVVHVDCTFNAATGHALWLLRGKDPDTGLLADFLPPNTNDADPKGRGWVSYSIKTKPDLDTGTVIKNKASIDFEIGVPPDPMDTPEVFNTIDSGAPESNVLPLPVIQTALSFDVSWTGNDDTGGSDIKNYDIYVSDNGGPYNLWITTTETSSVFTGQNGHQYSFYSRARDNVGNIEEAPESPDAICKVATPLISRIRGVKSPGAVVRIIGENFGATQGDSVIHIGSTVYRLDNERILLWTDTRIKLRLPNYKCTRFAGHDYLYRRAWVTVEGINSNKRRIKVVKRATCP
jgi:hypothetical protein